MKGWDEGVLENEVRVSIGIVSGHGRGLDGLVWIGLDTLDGLVWMSWECGEERF